MAGQDGTAKGGDEAARIRTDRGPGMIRTLAALLLLGAAPLWTSPAGAETMERSPIPPAAPGRTAAAPARPEEPARPEPLTRSASETADAPFAFAMAAAPAPPAAARPLGEAPLGEAPGADRITRSSSNIPAAREEPLDQAASGLPLADLPPRIPVEMLPASFAEAEALARATPPAPEVTLAAMPAAAPAIAPAPMPPAAEEAAKAAATAVPAEAPAPEGPEATQTAETVPTAPVLRPRLRPPEVEARARTLAAEREAAEAAAKEAQVAEAEAARAATIAASLRPRARPEKVVKAAARTATAAPAPAPKADPAPKGGKQAKAPVSAKGSVCGVAAIKGETIAPITSKVAGCGLKEGVRVTSVSGVRLSMPATIDCATAKALNTWVEGVLQPAYGGQVTELKIAGHYVCRTRNHKAGAKVSEHGRGKAIDISGITLASGKTQSVLKNYDVTMRKAHKGACGIFGTTLGPGSDGYHEDHLHFDTASHRSGSYCR
ncbi:extensin family protein [Pseudogemmobacter sonorensis]|uniref:extensin-like domain-containing protein n=1 Tax=Pseudogemmobacter sonorensis TaxID=2989681 RepID=UPI003689F6F5